MNQFDQQWRKLITLARQAHGLREDTVPYGFATRVAARAVTMPASPPWAFAEHFAVRGLMVAAALGLTAIAVDYATFVTSTQTDAYVAADAVVSEILDLS